MRTLLTAALIPAAASAHILSTARTPIILRATATTMNVQSWYDQGTRLSVQDRLVAAMDGVVQPTAVVESWYDNGVRINLPAGMSAKMAAASPELFEKALAYQADVAKLQARLDAFPTKEGTMVGILRDKLKLAERLLELTVESAREAAPEAGQRREAYYCNDQGCWVAEQYFCDETGCWITDEAAVQLPKEAPKEVSKKAPAAKKEKTIVQQGIFAPAVGLAVEVMGRKELNAFRASVIAEHTKVISAFVDTSESRFGQIALRSLFEAADKDGNGTLDKQEVKDALNAVGFTFIEDKQVDVIFKRADSDKNEVIDFEEFVKETPKTLRTSLVKLAKQNGHDLGFLA